MKLVAILLVLLVIALLLLVVLFHERDLSKKARLQEWFDRMEDFIIVLEDSFHEEK